MKLKGIELKGTYKVVYYSTYFMVYDEKGNEIYFENSDGNWSNREYDKKGNQIYFEDRSHIIINKRVKELTIEEIENLLGYKIKIKGERK